MTPGSSDGPDALAGQRLAEDDAARHAALDPGRSFLVQAPAGSGKTELLTRRFLGLLAWVEEPEEVLAITFTRKAAAEMRDRILGAMERVAGGGGEDLAPELRALAGAALARDTERGWRLLEAPARLRVMTIDSLCGMIARARPLSAALGAPGEPVDKPEEYYLEAVRGVLTHPEPGPAVRAARRRLLEHLDNSLPRLEGLLVGMLTRRDQWQRGVPGAGSRAALERALGNAVCDALGAARDALAPWAGELLALARYAADNLPPEAPLAAWRDLTALPEATPDALAPWRALPSLLLTQDNGWRKQVNKNNGFPSDKGEAAEWKARWKALAGELAGVPRLDALLAGLRGLPAPCYDDAQWAVLEALLQLMKVAAAELNVVFALRGVSDFTGVALAALEALGGPESPTELLLGLDARIRHILVDEFQDTSKLQYELLDALTAGWTQGDGRSLFLVGDPMQSIYRFRAALVGLFLETRHQARLGNVGLTSLGLKANFRSAAPLVDWVNTAMPALFPADDPGSGAVGFEPAAATQADREAARVQIHPLLDSPGGEADCVARLATDILARRPGASVAVLAQARSHLDGITRALTRAGIAYRGVDLNALAERPCVQDLLALTRALGHPADRTAWLAVLRAPWCGLTLAALHVLVEGAPLRAVWSLLAEPGRLARLAPGDRARVERLCAALGPWLAQVGRSPARAVVEGAWVALGGPACLQGLEAWQDCESYLALLGELAGPRGWPEAAELGRALAARWVTPAAAGEALVQVMTLHKAKGLQFDAVIVPGLARRLRGDDRPLLLSVPHPSARDVREGLLAPIPSAGETGELYAWLRALDRQQAGHEQARLLYVAATRARQELHWVVSLKRDSKGFIGKPTQGTLLARLWPALEPGLAAQGLAVGTPGPQAPAGPPAEAVQGGLVRVDVGEGAGADLQRVPIDWSPPSPPAAFPWRPSRPEAELQPLEFTWVGTTARHVGTLVHRLLARVASDGLTAWDPARVEALAPRLARHLAALGVTADALDEATARTCRALAGALRSPRGRWCLGPHLDARSEWPLAGLLEGQLCQVVLDRSFLDDAGTRWVVDYKTGEHEGGDPEAFLDRERERYAAQLERYAALLRGLEQRPIRLGLYYPLLDGWREWAPGE